MPGVHGTKGLAGNAPKIAIGAAVVALLTSLVAVIVVVSRGGEAPVSAASTGSSREPKAGAAQPSPPPRAKRVAASDVVKLRREAVTLAREAGRPIGVKVIDDEVRKALELEPDDVITALAGRTIEREYDLLDAMYGLRRLRASTVYVELLRDGDPVLVVWKVDGDLLSARPPDPSGLGGYAGITGSSIAGGGLGGVGSDPFGPSRDPLADTINRIDDRSFEVPRSTVERVSSSPSTYAHVVRTIPARGATGFRVYGIRPGTVVAAIGITNGDTIRAVNGNAVKSIDEVGELYPQIKDAKEWRIDIDRRGRPMLITITIK